MILFSILVLMNDRRIACQPVLKFFYLATKLIAKDLTFDSCEKYEVAIPFSQFLKLDC